MWWDGAEVASPANTEFGDSCCSAAATTGTTTQIAASSCGAASPGHDRRREGGIGESRDSSLGASRDSRSGEFDTERQPVEAAADRRDGFGVRVVEAVVG